MKTECKKRVPFGQNLWPERPGSMAMAENILIKTLKLEKRKKVRETRTRVWRRKES